VPYSELCESELIGTGWHATVWFEMARIGLDEKLDTIGIEFRVAINN